MGRYRVMGAQRSGRGRRISESSRTARSRNPVSKKEEGGQEEEEEESKKRKRRTRRRKKEEKGRRKRVRRREGEEEKEGQNIRLVELLRSDFRQ